MALSWTSLLRLLLYTAGAIVAALLGLVFIAWRATEKEMPREGSWWLTFVAIGWLAFVSGVIKIG